MANSRKTSEELVKMKGRLSVLQHALMIESITSNMLGVLIGIKEPNKSLSLGTKSSTLSFNHKINLLIDIGAMSSSDQNKFKAFMEIRNKFAHDINATNALTCLSIIPDTRSFIAKNYFETKKVEYSEKDYEEAVLKLSKEVFTLAFNVAHVVKVKIRKEVMSEFSIAVVSVISESVKQAKTKYFNMVDAKYEKGKKHYSSEQVKIIIDNFSRQIVHNLQVLTKEKTDADLYEALQKRPESKH